MNIHGRPSMFVHGSKGPRKLSGNADRCLSPRNISVHPFWPFSLRVFYRSKPSLFPRDQISLLFTLTLPLSLIKNGQATKKKLFFSFFSIIISFGKTLWENEKSNLFLKMFFLTCVVWVPVTPFFVPPASSYFIAVCLFPGGYNAGTCMDREEEKTIPQIAKAAESERPFFSSTPEFESCASREREKKNTERE